MIARIGIPIIVILFQIVYWTVGKFNYFTPEDKTWAANLFPIAIMIIYVIDERGIKILKLHIFLPCFNTNWSRLVPSMGGYSIKKYIY